MTVKYFGKGAEFFGRNGLFEQSGIEVNITKHSSCLRLEPIRKKGKVGRGFLEIPSLDVKMVIAVLNQLNLQISCDKPLSAHIIIEINYGMVSEPVLFYDESEAGIYFEKLLKKNGFPEKSNTESWTEYRVNRSLDSISRRWRVQWYVNCPFSNQNYSKQPQ